MKITTGIFGKAFLFAFFLLISFTPCQASTLENIPLNSWVYQAVDELYAQGFFPGLHKNVRPYQRGKIASYLIEIDEKIKHENLTLREHQLWLLDKLKDEFSWEIKTLREAKKKNLVKYGVAPFLYLTQNRIDTSWTRGQLELDLGFQFKERFLVKDKVLIDTRAEKDPNLYGREWENDLTGIIDQGYLKLDLKPISFLLGRDYLRWGPGAKDFLLLSGFAPPFDMLKLEAGTGWFKFLFFATSLDEKTISDTLHNRYLSGHRINIKPRPYLELGASEVVVYGGAGRSWELHYLNPILLYYGEQFNQRKDDNPLWSLDFSFTGIRDVELYGEVLIDDFQFDFKTEPHQIGFKLGANYANFLDLKGSLFSLEYQRINNWVYGQNKPWNLYTFHDVGMGSSLGPDADRASFVSLYHLSRDFQLSLFLTYARKGEGKIAPQPPKVPRHQKFPSGVVEQTKSVGLLLLFQPDASLLIQTAVGFNRVDNWLNQQDQDEDNFYLRLKLDYNFWEERWF